MADMRGKFHLNPSTKYRDITSREIAANGQTTDEGRTDVQTDDPKPQCRSPPIVGSGGIKNNHLSRQS